MPISLRSFSCAELRAESLPAESPPPHRTYPWRAVRGKVDATISSRPMRHRRPRHRRRRPRHRRPRRRHRRASKRGTADDAEATSPVPPPPSPCVLLFPPPALFEPSTAHSCCRQREDIATAIVAKTSSSPTNEDVHPREVIHGVGYGRSASFGARNIVAPPPVMIRVHPLSILSSLHVFVFVDPDDCVVRDQGHVFARSARGFLLRKGLLFVSTHRSCGDDATAAHPLPTRHRSHERQLLP